MFDLLIATASKIKTTVATTLHAINRELLRVHWMIVAAFAVAFLCIF